MKTVHEIQFTNYADITSRRRTLFHMPIIVDEHPFTVGDDLRLLAHPNYPRCYIGVLTDVSQTHLLDDLDADLNKLCADDRAAYLARWDGLHPKMSSANNPTVWRIEFRYGPPEVSLAT